MKKILSMLLCALLVVSSMATVVFADAPEAITFGNYLAQIPAGSKIIVNTGDIAEGNTVVATINGVESAVSLDNGYYAVTVPAGDNNISVAVKDGNTIVAKTETINVFGVSYLGDGEVHQNATFETDSTGTVGNKFGYYDVGMNPVWYTSNLATHRVAIGNESENQYLSIVTWGSLASDPNDDEGYTKVVNGQNTQIASGVARTYMGNVSKVSIDYRLDKLDTIDPETGDITATYLFRNTDEILVSKQAGTENTVLAECSILSMQYWWDDTDDYNKNNTITDERTAFTYWYFDFSTGKPTFKAFDENGEMVKFPVDNFNEGWNNYSVIVDVPNDTVYGYINDVYVGSGRLAGVAYAANHEKAGQRKHVVAKQGTWPYTNNLRPYREYDAVAYSSMDNFYVTTYANGFASTEPQIDVVNSSTASVQPAGSKVDIAVTAVNIPVGGGVAAFVNGVKTPLAKKNGKYVYNDVLEVGYTSVSVAMVDARGNIVVDSEGEEIKSEEWTYYAFGSAGDEKQIQGINPELELPTYAEYAAADSETKRAYDILAQNAGYNGFNEYHTLTDYAAKTGANAASTNKLVVSGTDDKYFSVTTWGSKYADPIYTTNPDAARKDGSGGIFTSVTRSGDTGSATVDRYWDMSVNYKVDSVDITEVGTGELVRTVYIDSADTLKGVWHWAEWNIMDNQYVWDSNYNGLRGTKTLFGFDKTTGKPFARTYDETGAAVNTIVDVNPGEWHNYRAIVDIEENYLYLLVDGVLVSQGSIGTYNTSTTDITEVLWPHLLTGRQYASDDDSSNNWTYNERMHASFDDWTIVTYNAMDDVTEAIVNAAITEAGASLGIIPANLGLEDGVAIDIAVIAKTAAGDVDMIKYENVTNESAYKAFGFDMAGIDKVFVWNWSNLSNIELITK